MDIHRQNLADVKETLEQISHCDMTGNQQFTEILTELEDLSVSIQEQLDNGSPIYAFVDYTFRINTQKAILKQLCTI